jgi:hypothetical protein
MLHYYQRTVQCFYSKEKGLLQLLTFILYTNFIQRFP